VQDFSCTRFFILIPIGCCNETSISLIKGTTDLFELQLIPLVSGRPFEYPLACPAVHSRPEPGKLAFARMMDNPVANQQP
jgi:hypothetical protein